MLSLMDLLVDAGALETDFDGFFAVALEWCYICFFFA